MRRTWSKAAQKRHRKALVEALRNGGYRQGTKLLCNAKDGMCCLGVASDISGLGHWEWSEVAGCWVFVDKEGERSLDLLTSLVRRYYGFVSNYGHYGRDWDNLAKDNDAGKRFKTIAKIIESEPERMFDD